MKKTITIEIPEEEAIKFSDDVARLVAQMKNAEVEDLERQVRSAQRKAEFEDMIASIRRSLQRMEQYHLASALYWQERLRQQKLELEHLKREKRYLLKQLMLACVYCWLACATAFAQGSPAAPAPAVEEASQLNQQAVRLYQEGKYAEAIPLAKKALKLREQALGENHELVGITLFNLGSFYYANQQYFEAESPYKRVLKIYETNYGKEDDRLEILLIRLGWISHSKGDAGATESYFKRNLAIAEKNHGQEHANVENALLALGQFQEKIGKPAQAVPFYVRTIAMQEKLYGAVHERIADTAEKCACLMMISKNAKGGEYRERAVTIRKKLDPNTASVSSGVLQGTALYKAQPAYPQAAKSGRVQGVVVVRVRIDESGNVIEANRLCGPDLLAPDSVAAARQWRFKPTLLDGKPIKVQGELTFNFTLQ